jgi:uncharacterized C2H2 Zn-finger protein
MSEIYTCKTCYKEFNKKQSYDRHKNKKNTCYTELTCPKCNEKFKYKYNYDRHINRKKPCVINSNELITNKNSRVNALELEVKLLKNRIIELKNDKDRMSNQILKMTKIIDRSLARTSRKTAAIKLNIIGEEFFPSLVLEKMTSVTNIHFSQLKCEYYNIPTASRDELLTQLYNQFYKVVYHNKEIPENKIIIPNKNKSKYEVHINSNEWSDKFHNDVYIIIYNSLMRFYNNIVKPLRDDVGRVEKKYKYLLFIFSWFEDFPLKTDNPFINIINNIKLNLQKKIR